ncbi:unnamed protein product [Alopecurus aequalis]
MCFLVSCCLRWILKLLALMSAAAEALLATVRGRKETSCRTKVAVCVSKTITYFLVSVLSVYLLRHIFFRPYQIRPTISNAVLTTFDLDNKSDPTLTYNITLNVAFFNAHRVYTVRFNHLTAVVYYNGTRLGGDHGTQLPDSFRLWPRHRSADGSVLSGQAADVNAAVAEEFSREQEQGHFSVDVVVKTTLTYKFWPTKAVYYYEYHCGLIFPDPTKVGDGKGAPAVTGDVRCLVAN